jgi:hypothetical protein
MSVHPAPTARTSAALQLDEIDTVLSQTVAAAGERERPLAAPAPAEAGWDREQALRDLFEHLQARLQSFHKCTERAERQAAEADAALAQSEDALCRWLDELTAARQRLADWAARVV